MYAEWATCVFPNAFLWKWSLVPTDKEDQGRDGKMISLLEAPSSRLIGMLRIGKDGLILFMEPTSFIDRKIDRCEVVECPKGEGHLHWKVNWMCRPQDLPFQAIFSSGGPPFQILFHLYFHFYFFLNCILKPNFCQFWLNFSSRDPTFEKVGGTYLPKNFSSTASPPPPPP